MSRRIFLADDSVTIQKVIELTFSDGDYEVQSVSNGDEALAALPTADPDFIILDVHMPGANGYEVCRRAKQSHPGIPVLLLVGTFEPFDEGHARSSGADSFLKKPFDSQELLERVELLLASRSPEPAALSWDEPAPLPLSDVLPYEPASPFGAPPSTSHLPPLAGAETVLQPLPTLETGEPSWGSFELSPDPDSLPAEPLAASPFDREPSFQLEPDPGYSAPAEPVFSFDEQEPAIAFGAADEAPEAELHDRFVVEETPEPPFAHLSPPPAWPGAPEPADLPEPDLELDLPEEPLTPSWADAAQPIPPSFEPEPEPAWSAPALEPGWTPAPPEPVWDPPSPAAPEPVWSAPIAPAASVAAATPIAPAAAAPAVANGRLSDEEVERIARKVVSLLGDKAVREIAWEVVPDLAEVIIRDRLRDLEGQVETL